MPALVALAAAVAPVPAAAQAPIGFDSLVALTAPAPSVRVAYGADPLQFGNLRLPAGTGPHPVVVFVHGGCWLSQYDIAHVAPVEQAVADAGYAVWSLEYRRVGDAGGGWPGTFRDVAAGADHVRALAATYPLDLSRVIAMGHSAGGHFALWLAARPRIPAASELHDPAPLPVHGVLGLAPAPDLEGLQEVGVCGNVVDSLMGGSPTARPERYAAGSPMALAPIAVPSTLIVGGRDTRWAPIGSTYYEHARSAGDPLVQLVEAPASGHFDVIAPTTATWRLVTASLDALVTHLGEARRP